MRLPSRTRTVTRGLRTLQRFASDHGARLRESLAVGGPFTHVGAERLTVGGRFIGGIACEEEHVLHVVTSFVSVIVVDCHRHDERRNEIRTHAPKIRGKIPGALNGRVPSGIHRPVPDEATTKAQLRLSRTHARKHGYPEPVPEPDTPTGANVSTMNRDSTSQDGSQRSRKRPNPWSGLLSQSRDQGFLGRGGEI